MSRYKPHGKLKGFAKWLRCCTISKVMKRLSTRRDSLTPTHRLDTGSVFSLQRYNFRIFCICLFFFILLNPSLSLGVGELPEQKEVASEGNTVRSLVITGNHSLPDYQIRALMKTDVWALYDEAVLHQDFEAIEQFYREKGFRFARVPKEQFTVKKFSDGIYIGIVIDEGLIGQISVSGEEKTKTEVILRELLFEVGDVYTEADKEESERILRQKAYLGDTKIHAGWNEQQQTVSVNVIVVDLLPTLLPALDPSQYLNSERRYLFAQIRESNLFGSGQGVQLRYERVSEGDDKTRSRFWGKYEVPRVFESRWNFDGEYIQKREGDSWVVLLERPQYTLKSRWSASFGLSESVDEVSWYESGKKTDIFERNVHGASGSVRRYFGGRQQQIYVGLWTVSKRSKYLLIGKSGASAAAPVNRDIKRVGFTVGRKHVAYHQTRFIRRMGSVEDFFVGSQYGLSIGHASPLYGSDRSESSVELALYSGWLQGDWLLGTSEVALSTNFTSRIERPIFQARTSLFYTDVFNTGDMYTLESGFRDNGLFDFHQTFVAQFKTEMQFGWSGESQVFLGTFNGLRGYTYRQFNGEKMMLLSLESRTVLGGTFFRGLNQGIDAIATFCVRPFIKNEVNLGLVLSATAFADIGYIWNGKRTFNLSEPKRSVGFGIRGSFTRVSGAGIFRIELAFPFDAPAPPSLKPKIAYGIERTF